MSRSSTGRPSRTADFGFGVQLRTGAGGSTTFSVESELSRLGLPGHVLRSSDRRAPLINGTRWPPGIRWSIDDRLRSQGARKGRVLAIWQNDQVLAACSWHLPDSGPAVILDLACRDDLDSTTAKLLATALLLCLRQIAGVSAHGRDTDTLRWTNSALKRVPNHKERKQALHAARTRAEDLGFEPMRSRPKWIKKDWAVERRFD